MSDPSMTGDLVERLRNWLLKRGEPDSGISYEGASTGRRARVEVYGSDATFIVDNFHGQGARRLAGAITKQADEIETAWQEFGNVPRDCSLSEHTKAALDELAGIAEDERRRAETAEARIAVLEAALRPFAEGSIDVSGTAIILNSVEAMSMALAAARNAMVTP